MTRMLNESADYFSEQNQISVGGVESFDENTRTPLVFLFKDASADDEATVETKENEKQSCPSVATSSPSTSQGATMKHPHGEQVKLIGVLGGVGPMAGVALQEKIVKATKANIDQKHLSTLHFCCPSYIGDRTRFILDGCNKDTPNPGDGMFEVARVLSISAHAMGMSAVVGVPCNTFHADGIFKQFVFRVEQWNEQNGYTSNSPGHLKVLNMIELTLNSIKETGVSRVGIMCTSGTREARLYDNIADRIDGVEMVHVAEDVQENVQDSIYNPDDGLKALSRGTQRVVDLLSDQVETLVNEQDAEVVILGCTELPLALPESTLCGVRLVDPMDILAEALIAEALGSKSC